MQIKHSLIKKSSLLKNNLFSPFFSFLGRTCSIKKIFLRNICLTIFVIYNDNLTGALQFLLSKGDTDPDKLKDLNLPFRFLSNFFANRATFSNKI